MTTATKSDPRWLGVFLRNLKAAGLPEPKREALFARPRKWRIDLFWEGHLGATAYDWILPIAIEVEGGAWVGGRHTRGRGFASDMEKYREMTLRGIRLLRYQPSEMMTGLPIEHLRRLL